LARYVVDTNVLIHAIRNEAARERLAAWQRRLAPHIHQHAVVVAELLIGAPDEAAYERWYGRWVAPAERVRRLITPSAGVWARAARIIPRLLTAGHVTRSGISQSFFNDCLLAASAREDGYVLVTHDLADFELIARVEPGFSFVPPFP
jgi:predicted nucleic acid-binding protein